MPCYEKEVIALNSVVGESVSCQPPSILSQCRDSILSRATSTCRFESFSSDISHSLNIEFFITNQCLEREPSPRSLVHSVLSGLSPKTSGLGN